MHNQMLSILIHVKCLCSTFYGRLLWLAALAWNFIRPEAYSFAVVGIAIAADLLWGIIVARKQGRFTLSEAARNTFVKVNIYGCALFLIYAIERALHDDWFIGCKISCAVAAACELWSISASMLIVKPDMPFLRLFRLQLKGEIAKKLGQEAGALLTENETNAKDK